MKFYDLVLNNIEALRYNQLVIVESIVFQSNRFVFKYMNSNPLPLWVICYLSEQQEILQIFFTAASWRSSYYFLFLSSSWFYRHNISLYVSPAELQMSPITFLQQHGLELSLYEKKKKNAISLIFTVVIMIVFNRAILAASISRQSQWAQRKVF